MMGIIKSEAQRAFFDSHRSNADLYRAKVYRHSQDHLRLTPQFQRDYQAFRKEDTAGISENRDQLFAIQQKLLDNLLVSIQLELNKII